MATNEKLDTIDLIISALREHEYTLDSLLNQMDRLIGLMSESMIEAHTFEAKISELENRLGKKRNLGKPKIHSKRVKHTKNKSTSVQ